MVKKWLETIPELSGDKQRRCYVYLPTGYNKDLKRRYPVLYMFDGQNVFFDSDATYGKSWGLKDYLDYTDTDLIVAAVECNDSADNSRLSEYSPYTFDDPEFGYFEGKGDITINWFLGTFKKKVDSTYRTLPDRGHTYIAGSSMGGLMSFYALLKYNRFFSKAAALSPSFLFSTKELIELIKTSSPGPNTTLYMDYGTEEFKNEKGMKAVYRKFCDEIMKKNINLTSRIVPGGQHNEASWQKQLPFMIHTLIYG